MGQVLSALHPSELWHHFFQLTQIPRPSRQEDKVREYIRELAKRKELKFAEDSAGNIVVYVPGRNGKEKHETLIIQNHMDMVCDFAPGTVIDFKNDPIVPQVVGEWVMASGTTLGSDNGIGCAAALALITADNLSHPPLELLFTTDEETGLHGAFHLDGSMLQGKRMLNLDTEEWGSLYIGCAGGKDMELTGKWRLIPRNEHHVAFRLEVKGLKGGHSGVDIHRQRANALKLLGELLMEVEALDLGLFALKGGRAHNIIPREAEAQFYLSPVQIKRLESICEEVYGRWCAYLPKEDEQVEIVLEEVESETQKVLAPEELKRLLSLIQLFPHGAHKYNLEAEDDLVSLSSNLAMVMVQDQDLYVQTSLRFLMKEELPYLVRSVHTLAQSFGLEVKEGVGYPSWAPVFQNALLDLVKEEFAKAYGHAPQVKAIHAGLECGILREKLGPIDIVSFGPTIENAHSPTERVHIPSVESFWNLLVKVLSRL